MRYFVYVRFGGFCHSDGSGLRLMECVRLRVKDIDINIDRKRLHILGKGDKWRSTILSNSVIPELKSQVEKVRELHQKELEAGFGDVYICQQF